MIKDLQNNLEKVAKKKLAVWWDNYVVDSSPFRGIDRKTSIEEFNKWYEKKDVSELTHKKQLELAIQFIKQKYSEDKIIGILFIEKLIPNIDWNTIVKKTRPLFSQGHIHDWNICDLFCTKVLRRLIKKEGLIVAKEINSWRRRRNVWEARASIVSFTGLMKERKYRDMVISSLPCLIKRKERFAKTAVGWLLRETSKEDKKKVLDFLKKYENHITGEVKRNALEYLTSVQRS